MVFSKIAVSVQRGLPFLGYHHVLIFFQIVTVVLWSILLAGCSSESTKNVYILGLSYTNSTPSDLNPTAQALSRTLSDLKASSQLEVRVGYFGLCAHRQAAEWICKSGARELMQLIGMEGDPLNLIGTVSKFQGDVVFSGLLFMAMVLSIISCLLMSTFPGWHTERDERTGSEVDVKPFPSRPVSQMALSCAGVSVMLSLIASLWQHVGAVGAAAMAEATNYGNVKSSIGTTAISFGWVGFSFAAIVAFGLLIMILSIIILDRLTDD